MRRIIALLISLAVFIAPLFVTANAVEASDEVCVWYFDDGSYITETFLIVQSRALGSITGTKTRIIMTVKGLLTGKLS